ncbi:MAG: hypothetical protein RBT71_05685 [Flavobacteriales bacterium]|jgi:hypothetical protein|nr:hypothetical protein [Flavobacteriales bacterium]
MKTKHLAIAATMGIALSACKKDAEAPPADPATPTTAHVMAHIAFVNGDAAFDTLPFTDGQGRSVRISKLKFYAHGFHLTDDLGATVADFHDRIILADAVAGTGHIDLGDVQPGHVHELHLALGLDSASSYGHADQATAPAPLNDPDMTWMWDVAQGRMFVKLEGFVDANGNGEFEVDEAFGYHGIGANMAPVPWHGHLHTDLAAGSHHTFHLELDVAALVGGLPLDGTYHNDGAEVQQVMQALHDALHAH